MVLFLTSSLVVLLLCSGFVESQSTPSQVVSKAQGWSSCLSVLSCFCRFWAECSYSHCFEDKHPPNCRS